MAATMMASTSMSSKQIASRPVTSRRTFAPLPAPGVSRRQMRPIYAEEKSKLDQFADAVEEKAQGFVEQTKENSGLGDLQLKPQPGKGSATTGLGRDTKVGATDVTETMSFAGLAPEIINGRAAMFAMLAAFGAEIRTHDPVFVQIQQTPKAIVATFLIIITASIIPIVRGADLNINGAGPFTQRAEVWNGRLAMVAFATLLAVETWKAGPGLVWW